MWGKGENAVKGMGHYREVGWGWGKGFVSLAEAGLRLFSASLRPHPLSRGRGHPPLNPSSASRLGGSTTGGCSIFDRVSGPAQGFTPCCTCGSKVTNEVQHLMRVSSWEGVLGVDRPYFVSAQVLDSSRGRGMTRGAGEMGGDGSGCEKMDM